MSNNNREILKCVDDREPIRLHPSNGGDQRFSIEEPPNGSWASDKTDVGTPELRSRIEPWLTALAQSEHLSLLVGSGLTHAVHRLATEGALPGMNEVDFGKWGGLIEAEANRNADQCQRQRGNFEDQLRAANEALRGAEIWGFGNASWTQNVDDLRGSLEKAMSNFAESILAGERKLAMAHEDKRTTAFNYLVSFLMSFASRSGTRERLQLFTTNYDRYVEAGADLAGLRLVDRFVGTLFPIFRASRLDIDMHYNPPGIRGEPRYLEGVARFTKLHGSVDWVDCDRTIRRIGLPFGATDPTPFLTAPGLVGVTPLQLMVYPNAAKDRETAAYPYVELFRDFAAAICRPNNTLFCYGYSFGDEHINRVIEDMLTIPSTHLVVISYDDPLGRIMAMFDRSNRQAQITLMIGNHLGDLSAVVDHYLPKSAIDRNTVRMAELLRARWTIPSQGSGLEREPAGQPGGESK